SAGKEGCAATRRPCGADVHPRARQPAGRLKPPRWHAGAVGRAGFAASAHRAPPGRFRPPLREDRECGIQAPRACFSTAYGLCLGGDKGLATGRPPLESRVLLITSDRAQRTLKERIRKAGNV